MKKEYQYSAFPEIDVDTDDYGKVNFFSKKGGMTLLDYFAAKAMQGQISHGELGSSADLSSIADWSYRQAAAMIEERKKYINE